MTWWLSFTILSTPREGGGGVLSYFHVYVGSGHFLFLGFKILNFIFFFFWGGGGVQKN